MKKKTIDRITPRTGAALGLGVAGLLALRLWVMEPAMVDSASMAPTIGAGSIIWLDKVGPALTGLDTGDVVTFREPDDGGLVVKRIVAVAGEEVAMLDGVLHVNGAPVTEPYVDHRTIDGAYFRLVRVGDGELFVMGDNRGDSIDSRHFGPIPADAVEARVIGIR